MVYEEGDEAFYVGLGRSRSEQMLFIYSGRLHARGHITVPRAHWHIIHSCVRPLASSSARLAPSPCLQPSKAAPPPTHTHTHRLRHHQ